MRTACFVTLATVLATACGGGGGNADDTPAADAPPGDVTTYDIMTSKGAIVLETHRSWSPHGVDRFAELVDAHFYDDTRVFRVITGFVAQFGINGTPATNAMFDEMTIPDDPVVGTNARGIVTFAQTGAPNSRTTQLFINYTDNSFLDSMGFSPIGEITTGMDLVDMFDDEYGEAPDQQMITEQGNAYLDASFPNLDSIVTVQAR